MTNAHHDPVFRGSGQFIIIFSRIVRLKLHKESISSKLINDQFVLLKAILEDFKIAGEEYNACLLLT